MALNRQLSIENSKYTYLEGMLVSDDKPAELITFVNDATTHAELMLKMMYDCFEEGKFCDVTLVVGDSEIKAHRLVLSSFSLYFRGLFDYGWKDSRQERFEITQFDEATLKSLLHFAYTGKLHLNASNVVRVLAAGDFLQLVNLDFVKESCGDYLMKHINKGNCVVMLFIAEQFNAVELKGILLKYVSRNFYEVSPSEDFCKLPPDLIVEILQSESLVVDLGKDFLPPSTDQEDFVLDIVLRYVSHQCEDEGESDLLLSKLIQSVRLCFASPSSMEKLHCYAEKAGCREAMKLIVQAMGTSEAIDDCLLELWRQQRKGGKPRNKCYRIYADKVHVGPTQYKFGNESFTEVPDLYITGMKIYIRLWDNRPVIGGLQIFYSNGESPIYGGHDEDSKVHEFHLDSDERIVKTEVRSGWMIDSLTFFTNKGKELGPYGGTGGDEHIEQPEGEYSFLSYLKGTIVLTQQKLGLTQLYLIWKEFLVDESDCHDKHDNESDRDVNEVVHESNFSSSQESSDIESDN